MSFSELLDRFKDLKALVIGDLMVDEYVFGKATRISPEAPVMVVRHHRTTRVPGGAANVARNLVALGAQARTVGVAGCDEAGDLLEVSLEQPGFTSVALIRDPERSTTRKTRVLADQSHQVLRIDYEEDSAVSEEIEAKIIEAAMSAIDQCDVVVLSDYLKGVLSENTAQQVIQRAMAKGKPVVVNPKPRSLPFYGSAALVSLNRSEASEALGIFGSLAEDSALSSAETLRSKIGVDGVLVTLGEAGMAAAGAQKFLIPAPKVEVYDTAGAGDTVIATVALGMAVRGFERQVFELAAQTSACVVRHVGVATPSESDLDQIRKL